MLLSNPPSFHVSSRFYVVLCMMLCTFQFVSCPSVSAATFSAKDTQIVAKAIGFLDPPPSGGTVALVYDPANPASKADADAIAALFAGGISEGGSSLTAKSVDVASLGDGSGYVALIAAQSATSDKIMLAAKAHHIPCITADTGSVQSGRCVMSVHSDPKVEIIVNHGAAQAAGVSFQSAFRMLIHEI